jgi:hypothetical protein
MCLLPAGVNFSGSYLFDGDDRKAERLLKLEAMLDDFDIVLLNEMWGSALEGATNPRRNFLFSASKKGFNVVTDPAGPVRMPRRPLPRASSCFMRAAARLRICRHAGPADSLSPPLAAPQLGECHFEPVSAAPRDLDHLQSHQGMAVVCSQRGLARRHRHTVSNVSPRSLASLMHI